MAFEEQVLEDLHDIKQAVQTLDNKVDGVLQWKV